MARVVAAGTARVACCAPIGTQLATNRPAAQPGTQLPRNTDPPVLYGRQTVPAQRVAQHPRNSSATTETPAGVRELRVAVPIDIFAPELVVDPNVHRHWIITIPGREPFVVIVSPDANIGQMRLKYSTATSIEPVAEAL